MRQAAFATSAAKDSRKRGYSLAFAHEPKPARAEQRVLNFRELALHYLFK